MQVQRPNITDFDVRRIVVPPPANHFTPLVQDVLGPASLVELVPAPLDPLGVEAKLQSALTGSNSSRTHRSTRAVARSGTEAAGNVRTKDATEADEAESMRRHLLTGVDGVCDVVLGWLAEVTDEKKFEIR